MTDHEPPPLGRIDLRALDEPADPFQVDRVVANVLRQATHDAALGRTDLLSRLGILVRPMIAAAAILILSATAVLRWRDDRTTGTPLTSVRSWTDAQRVPTNGELLAAFKGYTR